MHALDFESANGGTRRRRRRAHTWSKLMSMNSEHKCSQFGPSTLPLLLVGLSLIGCASPEVFAPTYDLRPSSVAIVALADPDERADEAGLRELAQLVPGFAGLTMRGDGELAVLLTAGASDLIALRAVSSRVRRVGRVGGAARPFLRTERVSYSFTQLAQWRDAIAPHLYATPGWSMLDLNEGENRIEVGITHQRYMPAVLNLLAAAGVPQLASRVRVEAESGEHASLSERMRQLTHEYSFFLS